MNKYPLSSQFIWSNHLIIWNTFRKMLSRSTSEVSTETSWSLGSLWVCMFISQSIVAFCLWSSWLFPSKTQIKTVGLGAFSYVGNSVSKKILWWTWIKKYFQPSSYQALSKWRHLWRPWIIMAQPFKYLCAAPRSAKLMEGIFIGPQIREVFKKIGDSYPQGPENIRNI